jgi:hypothetical protein
MSSYRGDTFHKRIVRICKWLDTERSLGEKFRTFRHPFLASHTGADAKILLAMGVLPDNIWAVDSDREEYGPLLPLQDMGVRVFGEDITHVINRFAQDQIGSVFLDYLGECSTKSIERTTRSVISQLPAGSVVSLTHIRGREKSGLESDKERERIITGIVGSSTKHPISLTQYLAYQSRDANTNGSPMLTMSYHLVKSNRQVERLDLSNYDDAYLLRMAKEQATQAGYDFNEKEIMLMTKNDLSKIARKAVKTRKENAKKRSDAAYRAWETRRANAKG